MTTFKQFLQEELTCPGCGSHTPPEHNTNDPDPKHKRLNPYKCPECGQTGGGVDWGMYDHDEDEQAAHNDNQARQHEQDMHENVRIGEAKMYRPGDEPHFGFEDKGNADKAAEAFKRGGWKFKRTTAGGIYYFHFDSEKARDNAARTAKYVIDHSKESEWGKPPRKPMKEAELDEATKGQKETFKQVSNFIKGKKSIFIGQPTGTVLDPYKDALKAAGIRFKKSSMQDEHDKKIATITFDNGYEFYVTSEGDAYLEKDGKGVGIDSPKDLIAQLKKKLSEATESSNALQSYADRLKAKGYDFTKGVFSREDFPALWFKGNLKDCALYIDDAGDMYFSDGNKAELVDSMKQLLSMMNKSKRK